MLRRCAEIAREYCRVGNSKLLRESDARRIAERIEARIVEITAEERLK